MLTYQVEDYNVCCPEIDPMFAGHFDEIAIDQDKIPLGKNEVEYQRLADAGQLHILTCRVDGRIVGYVFAIIRMGLHNKNSRLAYTDLYYILPEFRRGRIGIDLFIEYEKSLRKRNVHKIYVGTKVHAGLDRSKIFERLGWVRQEILFSKVLI